MSISDISQGSSYRIRDYLSSLNQPPISPNLGGFFKAGGHPQTPGRKFPAPLSQWSHYIRELTKTLLYFIVATQAASGSYYISDRIYLHRSLKHLGRGIQKMDLN